MKINYKLLSIFAVLLMALFACQSPNETGQQNVPGGGVVNPIPGGDGMTDVRYNTMQRDADRFQDRTRNVGTRDQYNVSQEAAERITEEVDEVRSAQVLTTNNNAYVAATLDTDDNNRGNVGNNRTNVGNVENRGTGTAGDRGMGQDELTEDVKNKIGDIVRSVDNNIDNVFVSTNPDFVDLTNNYVEDMNAGRPIGGFFDQIGNMIQRVFPQNR
ncbi:YhcN/YlaJ family sporulation lipoprotein [Oceanobacillus saliphilus]|uniref:YhcN/YlaJ family sporulation lipoprotein n=1 Tax=Oceanobacillus saliphilus TaxID=2925834 RepID=UPI00201DB7E4|nr:YhcN/YlaJ family sporulation lipoprotein [Oceanobacillus saliphilus]